MTHASQPKLCPECEQALEDKARVVPGLDYDVHWCQHDRAFAVIQTEDGWITDWAVQTCLNKVTAVQKIHAVRADMCAQIDKAVNEMVPASPDKSH